MVCAELTAPLRNKNQPITPKGLINRNQLSDGFWYFAHGWVKRAEQKIDQENGHFEGFIYLWVAFNGWVSQIITDDTKSDQDSYLVAALGVDQQPTNDFENLKNQNDGFKELTAQFASMWPVFRVRTLENSVSISGMVSLPEMNL